MPSLTVEIAVFIAVALIGGPATAGIALLIYMAAGTLWAVASTGHPATKRPTAPDTPIPAGLILAAKIAACIILTAALIAQLTLAI